MNVWVGACFGCLVTCFDDAMMKRLGGAKRREQATTGFMLELRGCMHSRYVVFVLKTHALEPKKGRLVRKPPLPPFGELVPCPGDSGTSNTNIRMGRRKICPGLGELDERALRGTQPPSHCGLACRAT